MSALNIQGRVSLEYATVLDGTVYADCNALICVVCIMSSLLTFKLRAIILFPPHLTALYEPGSFNIA